jgi:O-methyltransferase
MPANSRATADRRYLDLLKNVLTRRFFNESFDRIPTNNKTFWRATRSAAYNFANAVLAPAHMALVHSARPTGETMLDIERLDNIEHCIRTAVSDGIAGDVIETGVWRGGATIYMKAVLEILGAGDRKVWVADSFRGLPPPNAEKYPADSGDVFWKQSLDVPEAEVANNFERYGLLDDNVKFLVGFSATPCPRLRSINSPCCA